MRRMYKFRLNPFYGKYNVQIAEREKKNLYVKAPKVSSFDYYHRRSRQIVIVHLV
jgi:hypothetical protein